MFRFQAPSRNILFGAMAALITPGAPAGTHAFAQTADKPGTALTAGAGKATIDLTAGLLPIDGFTTLLDPLEVRVLLLSDGRRKAAIALIDQTSLGGHDLDAMKAVVASATGAAADDVLVVASHTFSAPHMFAANPPPGMSIDPEETARARQYVAHVMAALEQAASAAARTAGPATLHFGTDASRVAVNRNVETPDGWWLGANEAGYSDPTVAVLRLEGSDHRPIASLVNYAVQSSVMDQTGAPDGGKAVSADLAGATMRRVEDRLGGVSLFLTGAAGDQMPAYTARRHTYGENGRVGMVDLGAAAYPLVALQGDRLGDAALRAAAHAAPTGVPHLRLFHGQVSLTTQERPKQLAQIKPSRVYKYRIGGKALAPYTVLTLGDVALIGVQVELSAATGAWLRAHSPYRHTIVATMVNGAAKYLPDAQSYRRITYQAMNSSYGPGSAEVMARTIAVQLGRMAKAGKDAP